MEDFDLLDVDIEDDFENYDSTLECFQEQNNLKDLCSQLETTPNKLNKVQSNLKFEF